MSGPKHTPGPWRVKGDDSFGYFVVAPSFHGDAYDSVILGDDEYREEGKERNKADATLVAAALRLTEVLRSAPEPRDALSDDEDVELLRREYEKWHDAARAALREAGVTE